MKSSSLCQCLSCVLNFTKRFLVPEKERHISQQEVGKVTSCARAGHYGQIDVPTDAISRKGLTGSGLISAGQWSLGLQEETGVRSEQKANVWVALDTKNIQVITLSIVPFIADLYSMRDVQFVMGDSGRNIPDI